MAKSNYPDNDNTFIAAGLALKDFRAWKKARPTKAAGFAADRKRFGAFWKASSHLLARIPPKSNGL